MARRIFRRSLWTILPLLLFSAGSSPGIAGDQPEFRFRASSTEVQLIFSASDQSDHGVATLESSDFVVVDKDIIVRNFQSFTRSHWSRIELAILIDASDSAAPRFREEIAETLDLVSRTAGIPDDHLSIFSFRDSRPDLICAGNCRSTRAADHVSTNHSGGLTPLFDAIVVASEFLSERDAQAEKVLIVLSDGNDTISRHSLADAVDAAQSADISIYCLDISAGVSHGTGVLHALANSTGARYFPAPTGAVRALDAILEDFRVSYTVSYRLPSHAAGFHLVRILPTHNLNLHFRSRSGYYYPYDLH
ncbi:MAG TPA: VWA domain-containing protein [Candidatus Sulfotelmatobacter sp.]|nr:VWA domain-containing protein [Candidatus Sulfotelmatobacter sp.]